MKGDSINNPVSLNFFLSQSDTGCFIVIGIYIHIIEIRHLWDVWVLNPKENTVSEQNTV